ncbi:hypothetical protein [Streptomyces sp. NBC_01334]|uniref:hypothetical protein n=1 Tax=Streptomyces sp. NBC_01334 TaxID=2903827 RepID=UPI002E0EA46D|nr:hypothetical protein OG736_21580 [Streptomyces sp. NBC_01334]
MGTPAVGGPRGAARQGVISALQRPNPFPGTAARRGAEDPTPERPGIRIYAPPAYRDHNDGARWSKRTGDTPTGAYACPCGRAHTATGLRAVTALIADCDAHKAACTGAPASLPEGRTAA